jgi:hypothetical protein
VEVFDVSSRQESLARGIAASLYSIREFCGYPAGLLNSSPTQGSNFRNWFGLVSHVTRRRIRSTALCGGRRRKLHQLTRMVNDDAAADMSGRYSGSQSNLLVFGRPGSAGGCGDAGGGAATAACCCNTSGLETL